MKLLIVDDHPVLREGVAALLQQTEPDIEVLQARDAAEGLALVSRHADLDVLVLDFIMPGLGGLEAIAEFGRARPDLPVIVLSSSEDPQHARAALAQGALGYVPKSASQQTLLTAIRTVLGGEVYIPPLILTTGAPAAAPAGTPARLTERQVEVLRLISDGRSNREISYALGLSEKTVKVHITAVFRALNVVNRTQAARVGREAGLI